MLLRLRSTYFCCGVILDDADCVVQAAPIVRYMTGWNKERVIEYCTEKKWEILYC